MLWVIQISKSLTLSFCTCRTNRQVAQWNHRASKSHYCQLLKLSPLFARIPLTKQFVPGIIKISLQCPPNSLRLYSQANSFYSYLARKYYPFLSHLSLSLPLALYCLFFPCVCDHQRLKNLFHRTPSNNHHPSQAIKKNKYKEKRLHQRANSYYFLWWCVHCRRTL